MKLSKVDVKKIIKNGIVKIDALGVSKGSTIIIFRGNSYYVWKDEGMVCFQKKWFWSKKYAFTIAELAA